MLGLDYCTFELNGGNKYFLKAKNIVNNAQSSPEKGWKAYESDKNRYWIVEYLLDSRYSEYTQLLYDYHRVGLDVMFDDVEKGRIAIYTSLEELQKLKRKNGISYKTCFLKDLGLKTYLWFWLSSRAFDPCPSTHQNSIWKSIS